MKAHEQAILSHLAGGKNGAPHPVVKLAIKYWWMSIPVAMAMYGRYRSSMEDEGGYKLWQAFSDFGTVVGPVMTFVSLSELASSMDRRGKLDVGSGQVRDAEYEVTPAQPAQPQPEPMKQAPQYESQEM